LLLIQIAQPKEKKKKKKEQQQQQLALAQMFRTSSTWNYSVTDSTARPITYNIKNKKKKKKKKSNNNKLLNMMMIFAYSP
jgi:hypothetical protein